MYMNPYEVLGVSPAATEEEIARSYRKLAKLYHPDVNHGNEAAAKRMSEINAAYAQIKSGKASQAGGSGGEGGQGSPYGFGSNPFEDFDPFGAAGGGRGSAYSIFDAVRSYLNAGYFSNALTALAGVADRGAEWHYYSALANSGLGNGITALEHAKAAARMEPDNPEYRRVADLMEGGGRVYQERSQGYGVPAAGLNRICLSLLLTNLFCMFGGRICL